MEYHLKNGVGIGACIDVTASGGKVFVIQKNRLCVLTPDLKMLGTYEGIGSARQIEVKDGIAAISAREDGLWLFDVKGDTPRLLSYYQTLEFATGITLYADLVLVSCRQYGVEIIDIKDPEKPSYIGVVRMGEVQSACVCDGVLYGGVWGAMKVVAADISDINSPCTVGEIPLGGRGDGVVVRDGIMYAATGQHRRGLKNTVESDPCFGRGNGIEMYDVTDITAPRLIASDWFGYGYNAHFDTWDVMLCADTLVCSNPVLGVFGYDAKTLMRKFCITFEDDIHALGFTCCAGKLLVATNSDLYCLDALTLEDFYRYDIDKTLNVKKTPLSLSGDGILVCRCAIPSLGVADGCDKLALASGTHGLYTVKKDTFEVISHTKRTGFCSDVKVCGDYVYAAFSEDGFEVLDANTLETVSKMTFDCSVHQLCISKNGDFALVTLGGGELALVDVRDKTVPDILERRTRVRGLIYGSNFAPHLKNDGTMLMFWHRDGLVYADPESGDTNIHNIFYDKDIGYMRFGPETGIDTDGDNIFYNLEGGYILLPVSAVNADTLPRYKTDTPILGKLTVCGDTLIAIERAKGIITLTDISDIHAPVSISRLKTNASCERAEIIDGKVFIPARHDGLLELKI